MTKPKRAKAPKTVSVNVRIAPDLAEYLQAQADHNNRSTRAEFEEILKWRRAATGQAVAK